MKEKIIPYFGEGLLFEIYSSTEAGFVTSLRPADQLSKQSCAGLPHPQAGNVARRRRAGRVLRRQAGELQDPQGDPRHRCAAA